MSDVIWAALLASLIVGGLGLSIWALLAEHRAALRERRMLRRRY